MFLLQVALLSLDVYNDVQCSAVPALQADYLAEEAQADAEVCLHKLITSLSHEVDHSLTLCYVTACALYDVMYQQKHLDAWIHLQLPIAC